MNDGACSGLMLLDTHHPHRQLTISQFMARIKTMTRTRRTTKISIMVDLGELSKPILNT